MNCSDFTGFHNRLVSALQDKNSTCTGCAGCRNICPTNAIRMKENIWGFAIPDIEENKCIDCGLCERVCPKLSYPKVNNRKEPVCYAAQGPDDVRQVSSSGGLFSLLSEWILEKNGIVYGAAMQDDFSVCHCRVETSEGLKKLRKSKYVQSEIGEIYRKVKQDLQDMRPVLFSGCPCQIAALNNFLGKDHDQLYTVDILCHGVPSDKMLKAYLHENFQGPQVTKIDFRDKKAGWRADCLSVYYNDNTNEIFTTPNSAYEIGFQHNLALRDSCTSCEFCGHERQGDLTIGDFWHVEDYKTEWKDGKGTSVVLSNNQKGDLLLEAIRQKLKLFEKAPLEVAEKFNRINTTFDAHLMKNRFRELYPIHKNFTEAIDQTFGYKYDIGIVGLWTTNNYGGALTCYALYSVITELGYTAVMIGPPKNAKFKFPDRPPMFREAAYPDYAASRRHENLDDMKELNSRCKMFVVASDQLFNNNLFRGLGGYQILDWVFQSRKRIAYAASYGHDYIWGNDFDRAYMSNFMKKFDAFSVREDSGVAVSKREFGVEAEWVLDPIFLCEMEQYNRLANKGHKNIPTAPYIFGYVLDPDGDKEHMYLKCSEFLKKPVCVLYDGDAKNVEAVVDTQQFGLSEHIKILKENKVEDFLAYIKNCDFMITDSFHGMCFAILYKKPFIAIGNRLRGLTRFTSILGLLKLENRLVFSVDEINKNVTSLLKPIDYTLTDSILNEERERCKKWLVDKLILPAEKKALSDYDALNVRCDTMVREYNRRIDALNKKICELEKNNEKTKKNNETQNNKIERGFKCLKEHGLGYTIKYMFSRV